MSFVSDALQLSERQRNVTSIWAVPPSELPDGAAQLVLVALAYTSHEVYAYQSGGPHGTWCLWLQDLADVRPDHNGRVTCREWAARWSELLAEFYPGPGYDPQAIAELIGGSEASA